MMGKEDAVTEAIGGILLLTLVVIGVTIVGVIIFSQPLPEDIPSTKIIAIHELTRSGVSTGKLYLTHDGGDPLENGSFRIKINNEYIPDANISLCQNNDCEAFDKSWTVGKSLQIQIADYPKNLIISYISGSSEYVFYSTGKFVNETERNVNSNSTPWYQDNIPPVITSVTVSNASGGNPPLEGCANAIIKWTASDNVQLKSAKIELFDGSTWTVIADPVSALKPHTWTVTQSAGAGRQIRVTVRDLNGNIASKTSDTFTIQDKTGPLVTIKKPQLGNIWMLGSQYPINWTSSDCDTVIGVTISLSTNNGGTWTDLSTGQPQSGTYQWLIPSNPALLSTQALIRINATDPSGNIGSSVSGRFTIGENDAPVVTLGAPNGGESWTGGSYQTISWSAVDTSGISQINLSFTTDGGTTWETIKTGLSNTGSYLWTVNNIPTHSAKVKIIATDNSGNTAADVSDDLFTIVLGTGMSVLVLTPNGGESLTPGSSYGITWNAAPPTILGVNISYSPDNEITWVPVAINAPQNGGVYAWTVPSNPTSQGRIKVEAYNDKSQVGTDTSDGPFTILNAPGSVAITSPNGGEIWDTQSVHQITWTASDPDGIISQDIFYSANNGGSWTSLASNYPNNSTSFTWTLPTTTTTSGLVRVSVKDTWGAVTSDQSNSVFTIQNAPPQVRIISPNGGESWVAGSNHLITWNATDPDGVTGMDLAYSLNGGFNWNTIVSGIANSDTYNWTVPSSASTTVKVRATAHDSVGNSASDMSDAVFSIAISPPQIHLTAPDGGQTWACGSSQTITWTASDSLGIASIDLAYSLNNNPLTTAIPGATGIANTGSFTWSPIPNTPSTQVKIVATAHNTAGNTASDSSDSFFTIADTTNPSITIGDPKSDVLWPRCSSGSCPSKITWSASDNVDVVRIRLDYSRDNGANYNLIIDPLSNNGYYYWYVPGPTAANCYVRAYAYDAAGNSAVATSPKFSIV